MRSAAIGPGGRIGQNPRFALAAGALEDCINTRDIGAAWRAFLELKDLEQVFGRDEVIDALHRRLTADAIHAILRAVLPGFAGQSVPSDCDAAARQMYMFTKLLNYLLLVSKLFKGERNKVAVLRLTMGRCVRRAVDARLVRTAHEAKALVAACRRISENSSHALQLTAFELYMLVLGAWKSGRHLLVPYLYQQACRQYRAGDEKHFQRLSALVLAFYVREYAGSIGPAAIRGLLVDINQRAIKLLPHHYAMLILYFGKTGNLDEVLRVFEQAMADPAACAAEATYYNTFRAFGCAFALQKRHTASGAEAEADDGLDDDVYDNIDSVDDVAVEAAGSVAATGPARQLDRLQAARTCMRIFQGMTGSGVDVGFRTFRELMFCMFQFDMPDKARRVLVFAVENLPNADIKAHLVALYLRLAAPTPHERQLVLRGLLRQNDGLLMAVRSFPRRTLVDQFGIFDGNLAAFVAGAARQPTAERGGEFLRRFLSGMYKARRGAAFVRCMLAGSDPTGRFKGFNFPKLRADGSGLGAVEAEIDATCRYMSELSPAWLRHRDVIHALLPVLSAAPFGGGGGGANPDGASFIRDLVLECRDVGQFIVRLDDARIEGYDIELVNHFLRVKYLGLTFRRYAEEKAAVAGGGSGGTLGPRLFWPSFVYSMSHAPLVLGDRSPLASIDRGAYARQVAATIPAAMASWTQLTDICRCDPLSRISSNASTVGIFASIAGYAEDWAFGRRVWDDAARLMGRPGAAGMDGAPPLPEPPRPLEGVRPYKCYLNLATQATLARSRELPFGEDALVDMFALMDRNGVDVTSGLLCQAITAAFRVGQLDVAGALEQWQLHREQRGLAPAGFVQRYFAAQGLPEVPAELTSVLGLVRGAAGCPRLVDLIARRTRRGGR